MHTLKPFSPEKAKFLLEADLEISESILTFEYGLIDKANQFNLPERTQKWEASQIPSQDGLWNQTCFEAFLNPVGMMSYYEFNFSLNPAWRCYQFDRYRHPQPPKVAVDFAIRSIVWDQFESKLKVQVENHTKFKKFKVGLTAVLEGIDGTKFYCALAHKGPKADFHLLDSFTLARG